MRGFSDLFKIPTVPARRSPAPDLSTWKRPADILKGNTSLSLSEVTIPDLGAGLITDGGETGPPVTAQGYNAATAQSSSENLGISTEKSGTAPRAASPLALDPPETTPSVSLRTQFDNTLNDRAAVDVTNLHLTAPLVSAPPETSPPVSLYAHSSRQFDSTFDVKNTEAVSVPRETHPPDTEPPETGPPVSMRLVTTPSETTPTVSAIVPRKLQIREVKLVQEGHTYGEQTVYEALWKNGTVVNDSIRIITIGFLRMAGIAGLAESNCKAAVAGLLEKLAVERLPDKNVSQGRTYRVYSWTAVLARLERLDLHM
jgi:hypothetical protein